MSKEIEDQKVKAIKILEGAISILEENDLSKGWYARDHRGDEVGVLSSCATSFCVLGSMYRSAGIPCLSRCKVSGIIENIIEDIEFLIGYDCLADYNDNHDTTKEDIISVFNTEISRIRAFGVE